LLWFDPTLPAGITQREKHCKMNALTEQTAHPDSRALIESWRALVGQDDVGASQGMPPRNVNAFVERLFLLEQMDAPTWAFKVVGREIAGLTGRDLRGHDFASLWSGADRALVRALAQASLEASAPATIRARGETIERQRLEIEIVLAPMIVPRRGGARLLGLFQPLGGEALLRGRPLIRLAAMGLYPPTITGAAPGLMSKFKLVASND
jgi:hypothetical protein